MPLNNEEIAEGAANAVLSEMANTPGLDRNFLATALGKRGRADAVAAGLNDEEAKRVQVKSAEIGLSKWDEQHRRSVAPERSPAAVEVRKPSIPEETVTMRESPFTSGSRRVNVNFSDQAYKTLEGLARQTGRSMSDVLRDAIALKAWFEQTRAEGNHILVERPDGKLREVISV